MTLSVGLEPRSPKWEEVRRKYLKGKVCAACGKSMHLQAHHKIPFHIFSAWITKTAPWPDNLKEILVKVQLPENYFNGKTIEECELDENMLLPLCEIVGSNHHLDIGHLGAWRNFNPDVIRQAQNVLAHD
jgi:hypothetical protein